MKYFLFTILGIPSSWAAIHPNPSLAVERAKELKAYIKRETDNFQKRETQRYDLLGQLDRMNSDQNQVRDRLDSISANQAELQMALDNLALEFDKQKSLAALEKKRLQFLFKLVYKVRKNGLLPVLLSSGNPSEFPTRVRVIYRTLKSRTLASQQLEERTQRLALTEKKLNEKRVQMASLAGELEEQEGILKEFLVRKKKLLSKIQAQQSSYRAALKEYRDISKTVTALFENFENRRGVDSMAHPDSATLPLPVANGRITKQFGRLVNEQFGTVVYQKGIEIEAELNTNVMAVLPGVVEYEGWLKGLGNVVILHHGGGFYSLSAHLHKVLRPKGTQVAQGEPIGLVGDTGGSHTPSLYFELRENSRAVDPMSYFSPVALQNFNS